MDPEIPASQDGRRLRSQASRDRIVAAMLELVAEGRIAPSADEVASRATVGLRTVFRHFADMESLYATLTQTVAEQYRTWMTPFLSTGWRDNLAEMIDRRTTTYELLLPFKRAGDAHRHRSPTLKAEHLRVLALMRQRLQALLPAAVTENALAFETIDLLLSFEAWQRLRDEQQLPAETARHIVVQEVLRLADAG